MSKEVAQQLDVNDPNFWHDLETSDHEIIKWNPEGEYDKTFTPEEKQLLDCFHNLPTAPSIEVGDVITGQINKQTRKEIVIDVNYKDSIYVDVKAPDLAIIQNLNRGDDINVMITEITDTPYQIKGSITELIKMEVATKLRTHYLDRTSLVAHVKELIPAGFMLDIEMNNISVTAFMPNTLAGVNRLTPVQSQALVGTDVSVMLETLQQEKGVYVVSRKKYLRSLIPELVEEVKANLKEDPEKVYTGYVTGSKEFGEIGRAHV